MRRILKSSMQGVTLLEIMLVLAIAAMIIVMSIRYYQSATNAQQTTLAMSEINGVIAAADNLAIGPGTYAGVTTAAVTSIVGANNMTTPTQGAITISNPSATGYDLQAVMSTSTCGPVAEQLKSNKKITNSKCDNGTLTFTYDNSQAS